MSFLTPLYLLGALAVSLPVLFHMIRRTPRGRRDFSSVMFLEPSPPQITKRSRIEHWLLLFLRGLVLCVLALAFARPFMRVTQGEPPEAGDARDLVVLLDTSASMRRATLWDEAVSQVQKLLGEMQPLDRLSLVTFDRQSRVLLNFDHWSSLEPAERRAAANSVLDKTAPTRAATQLGRALIEAAERLDADTTGDNASRSQSIIVVSDLQEGSQLDDLQTYQWPPRIGVQFVRVGVDASPDNAGLQPLAKSSLLRFDADQIRVRVTNATDSRQERFTVRWANPSVATVSKSAPSSDRQAQPAAPEEVTVIVPPGQSRTIAAPKLPPGLEASALILEGDDHEFDNQCHVVAGEPRELTVVLLGDQQPDNAQEMRYYLENALVSTPERTIELRSFDQAEWLPSTDEKAAAELLIITQMPTAAQVEIVREFLQQGGTVLFVPTSAADASLLYELAGTPAGQISDALVDNYDMLVDIDFSHALFASLDHPRYSDFTKVRFWKHRTLDPATLPEGNVVAKFDDGDVAIGELPVGAGQLVYFTSGWHPEDSQLALSTKFVPMINGLLDRAAGIVENQNRYFVGDVVDLKQFKSSGNPIVAVRAPDGERIEVEDGAGDFRDTDQPGRYEVEFQQVEDLSPVFVVNLDPAESRTATLPHEFLAATGIALTSGEARSPRSDEEKRQLQASELEDQQKIWRWLILAAIILLIVETWLSGRTARYRTS